MQQHGLDLTTERRYAIRLTRPAYQGMWLGRNYVDSQLEPVGERLAWLWNTSREASKAAEEAGWKCGFAITSVIPE